MQERRELREPDLAGPRRSLLQSGYATYGPPIVLGTSFNATIATQTSTNGGAGRKLRSTLPYLDFIGE